MCIICGHQGTRQGSMSGILWDFPYRSARCAGTPQKRDTRLQNEIGMNFVNDFPPPRTCFCFFWGTWKSKPATNLGSTQLWTLCPPSVRGVFEIDSSSLLGCFSDQNEFQVTSSFLAAKTWVKCSSVTDLELPCPGKNCFGSTQDINCTEFIARSSLCSSGAATGLCSALSGNDHHTKDS